MERIGSDGKGGQSGDWRSQENPYGVIEFGIYIRVILFIRVIRGSDKRTSISFGIPLCLYKKSPDISAWAMITEG